MEDIFWGEWQVLYQIIPSINLISFQVKASSLESTLDSASLRSLLVTRLYLFLTGFLCLMILYQFYSTAIIFLLPNGYSPTPSVGFTQNPPFLFL